MPKMLCYCGNIINMSDIPCDAGYLVISEIDFEKIKEPIDLGELYSRMNSVIKCPKCGRLYPLGDDDTVYAKEERILK